jgi:membrane-bound serine protease (ClpP class)
MRRRSVEDPQATLPTGHRPATGRTVAVAKATVALLLGVIVLVAGGASPSQAQSPACDEATDVTVAEVAGLLDPVLVEFIESEVRAAADNCALALVLQLDSGGAVVSDERVAELLETIEGASVPVDVWVGPSGARATGEAVRLLAVADVTGLSPGSSVEVTSELLAARDIAPADLGSVRVGDRVGSDRAAELGLVDTNAPVVGEFVINQVEGVETQVTGEGEDRRREPVTPVRFVSLDLVEQLMHTVASPSVAYLLFVVGLALLLFELYTAGVGVAGVVGAGSLLLGSYGLATLPTRPLGVALLLFAMFGYGVDVQTGVARVWTGIATASFVLGSLLLFDGVSISWIALAAAFVGMPLAMVAGMPTMVRTRFSTPSIGRDWMIGEMGEAQTDVDPDGVIRVRQAPWRARTNRATPIRAHEPVRVVAIDGLVLEVEPETGGARDYRERRRSKD